MSLRGKPQRSQHETALVEEGALDVASDLFDDGDREIAKKAVTRVSSKNASAKHPVDGKKTTPIVAASSASSSAGPSSSGAKPDAPGKKALPSVPAGSHAYTCEQLKDLLPPLKGIRIWPGDSYHKRWRVTYPAKPPYAGTSRTFEGSLSEQSAIMHCLRWVWKAYIHFNSSAVCPWDLEGVV